MKKHASNSSTQGASEKKIRELLNTSKSWKLIKKKIQMREGGVVDVDGVDEKKRVLVEIISRVGKRSSSRDKKMVSDAAKLHYVASKHYRNFKKYIVGCDDQFLNCYRTAKSSKWQAFVIENFDVSILTVNLGNRIKKEIVGAQGKQGSSFKKIRKPASKSAVMKPRKR